MVEVELLLQLECLEARVGLAAAAAGAAVRAWHCTGHSLQDTVFSIQYTVYCILYSIQYTAYNIQNTVYSVQPLWPGTGQLRSYRSYNATAKDSTKIYSLNIFYSDKTPNQRLKCLQKIEESPCSNLCHLVLFKQMYFGSSVVENDFFFAFKDKEMCNYLQFLATWEWLYFWLVL